MSKDALLREMEAGFDSLLATVGGLSEEQMGRAWYGDWCVRDILAIAVHHYGDHGGHIREWREGEGV